MDVVCSICGAENDSYHDCLLVLMKQWKRLEIGHHLDDATKAGRLTEEQLVILRQQTEPIINKVGELMLKREKERLKFHRLMEEASAKFNDLKLDRRKIVDLLVKKLGEVDG